MAAGGGPADRLLGLQHQAQRARGPRSLLLRRCDQGFGFTLRHFIVYPPEVHTVLSLYPPGPGLDTLPPGEPMDTIFVKSVREHSPAEQAGLATGDRILSVNGQSVLGRSYQQVVQWIQHSGPGLQLLVVPREDDVLQLYFGDTAHNPETNARPRVPGPTSATLSGGWSVDSDSGSALSLDSDDSHILLRLRRSLQQREEFLLWPGARPVAPAPSPPAPVPPRLLYARPQRLPRPPWPPDGLRRAISDAQAPLSSNTSGPGPGPVPPSPPPLERAASEPCPPLAAAVPCPDQAVRRRARLWETGAGQSAADRARLHRSELARLSGTHSAAPVSMRRREFEGRAAAASASAPAPATPATPTVVTGRLSRSLDSPEPSVVALGSSGSRLPANCTIPVGGGRLHCAPPAEVPGTGVGDRDRGGARLRARSASAEAWPEPQRRRAVRQHSYLTAVHAPAGAAAMPERLASAGAEAAVAPVLRRPKQPTLAEEERVGRRVSYLRATWDARSHVDSDLELSDVEGPPEPAQAPNSTAAGAPAASATDGPAAAAAAAREGWLHCKIAQVDGRRAADRTWRPLWACLRAGRLSLSRGPDQAAEAQVDACGCTAEAAPDYSKRPHVLRLSAAPGWQLLLQATDASDLAGWLAALMTAATGPKAEIETEDELQCTEAQAEADAAPEAEPAPDTESQRAGSGGSLAIRRLATPFRARSPTGQSPATKTRKPSQGSDQQLPSPKSKTWKGKVVKQLRRMQQGSGPASPPAAPVPEGCSIGVPLEACPPASCSEHVPLLVERCTSAVEARGLDVLGIYRVPGNTAAVAALTEALSRGPPDPLDPRWADVNVVSSLLKLFFRRLPDALLTSRLYSSFIAADRLEPAGKRLLAIRRLVLELPPHHLATLRHLLLHLQKVVAHRSTNKMEARNLAIVFGPTLVRTADDNMVALVTDMSHQCRIVESLISHVEWFFSEEEEPPAPGHGQHAPASEELEVSATNHSVLLGNIHKVEGARPDSGRELSPRDLMSSIISAANRKMQRGRARSGRAGPDSAASANSASGSAQEEEIPPVPPTPQPSLEEPEPEPEAEPQRSHLQPQLLGPEQLSEQAAVPVPGEVPSVRRYVAGVPLAGDEAATIRTYTGLSATTQERIRRFELETRAMLQREQPGWPPVQPKRDLRMESAACASAIAECGATSDVAAPLSGALASCALKRLKTSDAQGGAAGAVRTGSLDRLQAAGSGAAGGSGCSAPAPDNGDESLAACFQRALRLAPAPLPELPTQPAATATSPAAAERPERTERPERRLRRCGSLSKADPRPEPGPPRLRRADSLGKAERRGLAADSEKENLAATNGLVTGATTGGVTSAGTGTVGNAVASSGGSRLKRRGGSGPGGRRQAVRRRHTVGGSKDLERRLQAAGCLQERNRPPLLRCSSPELGPGAAQPGTGGGGGGSAGARPRSLPLV